MRFTGGACVEAFSDTKAWVELVMANVTRREAVCAGICPLVMCLLPRILRTLFTIGDYSTKASVTPLESLKALFTNLQYPKAIGLHYLQSFSEEGSPAFLTKAILGDEETRGPKQLRAILAQKREEEFRDGNIAIVAGWVLSRTEARVCALMALT